MKNNNYRMKIIVGSQEALNDIPIDISDDLYIVFGTMAEPAYINKEFWKNINIYVSKLNFVKIINIGNAIVIKGSVQERIDDDYNKEVKKN